jgi:hypothetical protein
MGQTALENVEIYADDSVLDKDGVQHAGIQYSTVILRAGGGQLLNLIQQARVVPDITVIAFTTIGQSLHNKFEKYKQQLGQVTTDESTPVGVAISGDEEVVKQLTKKFSLLQ